MDPEELRRLWALFGGHGTGSVTALSRLPHEAFGPRPMAQDATAVAPGAVDPRKRNTSTAQDLLHRYGGGAHEDVMRELEGRPRGQDSIGPTSLPEHLRHKLSNSALGKVASAIGGFVGLGDPMSLMEGPGRAAFGAVGRFGDDAAKGIRGAFNPSNPPAVQNRAVSAVKLDDGTVLYDTEAAIHADAIENLGVDPSRVVEGGFIVDGAYRQGGADAARIGRQARAQREVERMDRIEPFRDIKKEDFLGNPRITSDRNAADLRPRMGKAKEVKAEPFGDYQIHRYVSPRGGGRYVVVDNGEPIAVYDGDTLVVDKKYRRQGLATDLVYDFRTRHPDVPPATHRTKAAQAVQEKVWERIQRELGAR